MDIKRAKQEIKNAVAAYLDKDETGAYTIPALRQRPLLLMGPPGVGKTQIMEQIARECGIGLVAYTITHHTRQSAVGLPFIRQRKFGGQDYSVTEYTMSEIIASVYRKMESTGLAEGILFIDEINCVSETLAPTMLQFLQGKTFGNQAVPAGWIIVAAGNPPEYNKSVREFDLVTLDRVRRMDVEPNLPVWQEYARAQRLHPAIQAYLELRPQHFYKIENDVDGPRFVTARGWEDLSALLLASARLDLPVDEGVIGQYLCHPEIARDFAAYWELYKKYRADYGVEDILQGRLADPVVERALRAGFDERLSLVSLLVSGLDTRFSAAGLADAVTDTCYHELRSFKQNLLAESNDGAAGSGTMDSATAVESIGSIAADSAGSSIPDPAALYTALGERFARRLAAAKAAGNLPMRDLTIRTRAAALLAGWADRLDGVTDPDAAFDAVREGFNLQVRKREEAVGQAAEALEYAFDFMERAFGEGQEMVVFVNELALGPDSAPFLAENECERFTLYSKRLLLADGQNELSAQLDAELGREDSRAEEHSRDF